MPSSDASGALEPFRDLFTNATVVLSTTNPDGSVQTTAVLMLLDDDGLLRMSLSTGRQKYRNMVRDPRATVFSLDPTNTYHFVEVRATVTIEPDTDKSFLLHVFETYGIDPLPDLLAEERVVVTFHPVRINAR